MGTKQAVWTVMLKAEDGDRQVPEEFGGESVVGAGDGEEWKGQKVVNEKEVRLRCC